MAVKFIYSQVIDRLLADVFHFYAHDYVRNHPRWDPDLELEQISNGLIGVRTVILRCNSRGGAPVDGIMEVVEYEPNRVIALINHEGPVEMHGRTIFEAINDYQTCITTSIDFPDMDEKMDKSFLNRRIEQSWMIRKQLMESEIPDGSNKS
jgi:hypothetical protein